jgi:hypothetical protein
MLVAGITTLVVGPYVVSYVFADRPVVYLAKKSVFALNLDRGHVHMLRGYPRDPLWMDVLEEQIASEGARAGIKWMSNWHLSALTWQDHGAAMGKSVWRVGGFSWVNHSAWLVPSCVLLGACSAAAFLRTPLRRMMRRRAGKCEYCGYDLRGTPGGRCTECGKPIPGRATPD